MENWLTLLFLMIVIGVSICVTLVKRSSARKAAQNGEDKERVHKAAEQLPGEDGNRQMFIIM